jgi:PBSX family phage terminase large subunit
MMLSAGMNDPHKIKSIQKPTDIWCEELTEFDLEDFEQLDLRLRGDGSYQTLFTGTFNPINEEHWIKKELVDKELKNSHLLKTTFKDNRFINQQEYEEKLMRQSPHNQRIYRYGDWGLLRTGKEYYYNFDSMKHVSDVQYKPNLPLHITFDFNVVPYMTLLVCQMEVFDGKMQIRVIDEFCMDHPYNKTRYVCQKFMYKYGEEGFNHKSGVFYYGDATSLKNNTMTVEEIRHDYDIVESVLRKMLHNSSDRTERRNPAVKRRKDFVIDILEGKTQIELLINKVCKYTINDFLYLKEGPDGKKFKETDEDTITGAKFQKYGHTSDALEYLLCRAFEKVFLQYERK